MSAASQKIEQAVRRTIVEKYQNATIAGELSVVTLQLDAAVEKLAKDRLGPVRSADLPTFDEKVKAVWFDHSQGLYQLHKRRSNQVGHETDIDPQEAIVLARDYVNTILRIWPDLFGVGNPPPRVTPPAIVSGFRSYPQEQRPFVTPPSTPQIVAPTHPTSKRHTGTAQRRIDWHLLLVVLALWALTSWLAGLTLGSLNGVSVLAILLAGVATLLTGLATLVVVVRFVRSAGLGLALASVLALGVGWWLFGLLVSNGPNPAFAHGYNFAPSLFGLVNSETQGDNGDPAFEETPPPTQPRPTRVNMVDAPKRETPVPTGGQLIEGQSPETPVPSSQNLAIGRRARVVTAGNRLNGRTDPNLSGAIKVSFENGEELDVIDGPVTADGYDWWLVRGKAGEGWSVDEFLEPIP
ncbi:MAG TPA: hypothetical protein PKE20_08415 [Promineifilum sp.]|nr:hypothetical protein [Promineifilum sp.]